MRNIKTFYVESTLRQDGRWEAKEFETFAEIMAVHHPAPLIFQGCPQ
jgi:hypothetical protein